MADSLTYLRLPAAPAIVKEGGLSADAVRHVEALYSVRRPEFIRFLARLGVDAVDAEDITQEVFLRTLDRPGNEEPENLFQWLLTCARNLAVDRYRRCRKEMPAPATLWKQWEKDLPDPKASSEESVFEEERYRLVVEQVGKLSEQEQQCLALRSQGVSFREIASILSVSPRQAAYLSDVAVDKLRRKLQSLSR